MEEMFMHGEQPPAGTLEEAGVARRSANYEPSAWDSDTFIHHTPPFQKPKEWIEGRIKELKEQVRAILRSTIDNVKMVSLIDTIERLGIGYHFKRDIDCALSHVHGAKHDDNGELHHVATRFRLLRQHGFKESCDVFLKFKDQKGNFHEKLREDAQGLLSLYNAGYLATPGEDILATSAISFARGHLTSMANSLKFPLKNQVLRALKTPLHKIMNRVEARLFIEEYHEEEGRNDVLLELAKLDFNVVQNLHLEEIKSLSLWWKEQNIGENLQYARDRLLECFVFWSVGLFFEPEYSRARVMVTKLLAMGTVVDDTFDVYGTYEECKLLNDAIQRWDTKAVDSLPVYLQRLFLTYINMVNGFEDELEPSEKYRFPYLVESIQKLLNGCMQEVEWNTVKHVPTFEERKRPALDDNAGVYAIMIAFIGMPGDSITKEIFQWLMTTTPAVALDCMSICRYIDEFTSFERETNAGQGPTAFVCYMIENKLTKEETIVKFQSFVEEAWKRQNQACFQPSSCPMPVLERLMNHSRLMETMYVYFNDGFNKCGNVRDIIALLLLKPFSI